MPEPTTLIVGGLALYAFLKGRGTTLAALPPAEQETALAASPTTATAGQSSITVVPFGAFQTTGSLVAAELGVPLDTSSFDPPADLVAALDNQTALMFRAYAALNPEDFGAFLERYVDKLTLRNDLMIEMLTNPPEQGFEVTPGMLAGMGTSAYKVIQAFNGVAAGKSIDVFGLGASVAGQIPGVNEDFVSSLQAAAMGYRAITTFQQVAAIAAANNVGIMSVTGSMTAGAGAGALTAYSFTGGLAGPLMAVGLVVDIGFTIIGDKPDLQKAIDVALDVASLAVLFIPGIGLLIAIVIQLVKFIIDLFGEDLFGGGMSHEQREILETARYGKNLNPMFGQLADAYTPRELWRTIVAWGSGYCGGIQVVAMSVNLVLHAGDTFRVGGQPWTVPPELDGLTFGFGDNEQPGGCYWIKSMPGPLPTITNDEQAWMLGAFASVNGILAGAQAGIADWRKVQFEDPTQRLIMARATPMREFLVTHRLSLDQIDQIVLEYRAQPYLNALAASFGWEFWQEFFAYVVADEWMLYSHSITDGSLSAFAQQNGYPTMYRFREAALGPWAFYYDRAVAASGRLYQNALVAQTAQWEAEQTALAFATMSTP